MSIQDLSVDSNTECVFGVTMCGQLQCREQVCKGGGSSRGPVPVHMTPVTGELPLPAAPGPGPWGLGGKTEV